MAGMLHRADACGCERRIGMSKAHIPQTCDHDNLLVYVNSLGRGSSKSRKRSGGISPASAAQREKVRDARCIVTGKDRHEATIHPAHLWDRGRGGCDDPLCVIPLAAEIHRPYDEKKFDLLPHLILHNCFAEMAHVIEDHRVSPTLLLERLTGTRWTPVERAAA